MASPPSPPLRVEGVEAFNRHDNKIQLLLKISEGVDLPPLDWCKEQAGSRGVSFTELK